jgi:cation:H+ antiporter
MTLLLLLGGLVLLILGGELLVRGAVAIATRLGVSPLMIGLTLVGFGTSTPELVTSLQAALAGSPGIAVGNVVGSNTANILLILGLAAVIRPVTATSAAFRRDGSVVVLAALLCAWASLSGEIGRGVGTLLVAALVAYVVLTYLLERQSTSPSAALHAAEAEAAPPAAGGPLRSFGSLLAGIAFTIAGARLLVDAAIELATGFGVSEAVIGLTIVAIGTSLPELVTSIMAALRGQSDVAFGNVIGSNIYNVLGILGVTALVQPLVVPAEIATLDIWVMLAATAALIVVTLTGWRVTRLEGGLMVAIYGAYLTWLALEAA